MTLAGRELASEIASARTAQRVWSERSVAGRLAVVRELRRLIAADPRKLAAACNRTNLVESLAAEVLPLADACRFLEKTADKTLEPKRLSGKGRASWLRGVQVELRRDALGVVLIVAPSNYPLMLPGIQALQALVAGNAVLWKPAAGCSASGTAVQKLLVASGLDQRLLTVLPDSIQAVQEAVASGVDKVVLTGSVPTGKAIQRLLADKLVPSTMELSGCDAMFVTDSANVQLAANCLRLGLRMNGSQTCIAPRRVFVNKRVEQRFRDELLRQLNYAKGNGTAQTVPSPPQQPHEDSINHDSGARVRGDKSDRPDKPSPERSSDPPGGRVSDGLVQAALASGAVVLSETPKVLSKVTPNMEITQSDIFEPVTSLIAYDTIDEAVAMNDECPYALGATVFGSDSKTTGEFTRRINAGCIVVNDMIVPTADPRVPFGGRKQSGFGVTRGTAGLEEMTQLKAIVTQRSSWLPHLDEPTPLDEDVMARLIQTLHTPNLFGRMRNSLRLAKAAMAQRKHRNKRQHR